MGSKFQDSINTFRQSATWLGDEHQPALVVLETLAEELDKGNVQAAMVAQFGLTYRALLKEAPKAPEGSGDPLEEALNGS